MKSVYSNFSITNMFGRIKESVLTYDREIKKNPDMSQKRAFISTVALAVVAAIGTRFSLKGGSLTAAAFTPFIVLYSQASLLIYSLKLRPAGEVDEKIAIDQKKIVHYGLIALTVLGGLGTAMLLQRSSGFSALFALLAAGTGAALWHEQGLIITPAAQ